MGSEEESSSNPFFYWDAVAEEELRAIEAAYASASAKRRLSKLEAQDTDAADQRSKGRRLPDWGSTTAVPLRHRAADGMPPSPRNGLWNLASRPCRENFKLKYPAMIFRGQIMYSRTASEVELATKEILDKIDAMKHNSDQVSLGFDIEWRPVFKRGASPRKAAVMQICMDNSHCYVMHIIHSGIPSILKSLLKDNSSVKVGIGVANDASKISKDYNVCVEPVEDLSSLANLKIGGAPKKWGLSSLTETVTCKQLEKPRKIRLGNWETNVLSTEQLQYAATDAFACWYLYQVLKGFPDATAEAEDVKQTSHAVS
ncbi:3'-5' exonuclease isoform X1 [Elaeis guineensis]|uniref:3'-5' exonuclease n=1 Tax=Elaeis guineensis var. tenera TaxID=51953 RepID=A0A6J0PH25_ELAGV|nr:Werner Syndrome-like exonuclease isoform X1 [Elaeis guineensis]XP_019705350.1 Werner Syndrome-like exonuclease isoform X1 [Elaeis guineensis]XP_029119829.1 Werner Syndrome-like exonuclease isoform X1 [Elaeis guineensis]XP_029119830.1 Werner Syndrome-like exonuclease isoform X1 [Elaeis guineensis]XP_029119831.1 Werner Syndrome-like exonuclease isoform X1 [Elaeis guineensis]